MKIRTVMYASRWKKKKQILCLTFSLLCFSSSLGARLHDEDDIMSHIQAFEENMENFHKGIMQAFEKNMNSTFTKFFQDFDARTQNRHQEYTPVNHKCQNFYKQSSNSLQFHTKDKKIHITENKTENKKLYTIKIIEQEPKNLLQNAHQKNDPVASVQSLLEYVQKNHLSTSAEIILQECIDTLTHEQKNKVVNIQSSSQGPQINISIDISHKPSKEENEKKEQTEEVHEIDDENDTSKSRKKKRSYNFTPRAKNKEDLKI